MWILAIENPGRVKGVFKQKIPSLKDIKIHDLSIIIGEDEVKGEYVNIRCIHSKEQSEVKLEDILSYIENHYEGDHEHE